MQKKAALLGSFSSVSPSGLHANKRVVSWSKAFYPIVIFVLTLSTTTIAGWMSGVKLLISVFPSSSPMSIYSAILFCIACISLISLKVRSRAPRRIAGFAALFIAATGLCNLIQYAFGINLGFFESRDSILSLRMSPISAMSFLLLGLALFLYCAFPLLQVMPIQIFALAEITIALFNIIGYFYSVTVFYHISPYKAISLRSSLCFMTSSIGILLNQPRKGLMNLILEESYGGLIIRRFLLFVITIPILLGGIASLAIQMGLLHPPNAILALVILTIVVFMILLLINGRTISRTETEKKQAEGEFRRIESNYHELFENMSNAVCICKPLENGRDFILLDINKAAERVEGIKKEESLGKSIRHAIPVFEVFGIYESIKQVWTMGQPLFREHSISMRGADTQWRKSRIYKLPSGEVVTIYDDITERKRIELEKNVLQYQLFESQKMEAIGTLAGGIAHDFNNFLTIINGFSSLLLENDHVGDSEKADLEEINKAANRASTLVQQLLAFSRKQLLQPEVLNVNSIIADNKKMLTTLISEKIELSIILDPELRSVKVDPSQMVQVIMNLAVNARDAMQNGGKLTIQTANVTVSEEYSAVHLDIDPGDYVLIEMRDTGTGMDSEILSHIFEPFFTTKETGKGTGLGLSTVYGIIKQSGGAIYAYSEPGNGTSFKIYLPTVVGRQSIPKHTNSNTAPTGSETILLVEDNTALRAFIKRILLANGYTVFDSGDGEEALQMAEERELHPDLLITDMIMPRMNGKKLAEHLRQLWPKINVLFISGYAEDSLRESGVPDPTTHFLHKPFNASTMLTEIRHMLDLGTTANKTLEAGTE